MHGVMRDLGIMVNSQGENVGKTVIIMMHQLGCAV